MPETTPAVTGILELALYVEDLERSGRFYADVFGFPELLADERMRAYDVRGRQILLLFLKGGSDQPNPSPGGIIPAHDADGRIHMAFSIAPDTLEAWRAHLAAHAVGVEAVVWPERGGTSLYLRDPDGHLLELATPGVWPTY